MAFLSGQWIGRTYLARPEGSPVHIRSDDQNSKHSLARAHHSAKSNGSSSLGGSCPAVPCSDVAGHRS